MPTFIEQLAIANFLDHKTSEIDDLIADKEKLIELLKEQRQAIITEAVTKGLNPDVKMKDSGVEWIGEIPEHWFFGKIVYFAKLKTGGTPDKNNKDYWEDGTVNWMSSSEVNKKFITSIDQRITPEGLKNSNANLLPINSVMIALNGQGKTKGTVAILKIESTCNQSLAAFICDEKKLHYMYLYYFLESRYKQLRSLVGDGLRDGLTLGLLKTLQVPLPELKEQVMVTEYVSKKEKLINTITNDISCQIQKLKEYRQSLIFEAVTGKIDVRDWADKPFERSVAVANA